MQSYKKNLQKLPCKLHGCVKIILVSCLLLPATLSLQAQNEKLQLNGNSFTIGEIFNYIEQQTGYNIGYNNLLDKSKRVTLKDPKETVAQVLPQALAGTGYTYRLDKAYIFIEKGEKKIDTHNLTGTVSDSRTGRLISQATIQVDKHPSLKATSNNSGEFTIKKVPVGDYTLRVTAEDYTPGRLTVSLNKNTGAKVRVRLTNIEPQENESASYADLSGVAPENTTREEVDETNAQPFSGDIINTTENFTGNTYKSIAGEPKTTHIPEMPMLFRGTEKEETKPYYPVFAIKTNLLYDLTTTFNLGAEVRLNDYLSLDVSVNYNPWTFSDNTKLKHIMVQPELRYWIHEPFNGHFLGAHLSYMDYNAGNINLPLDIFPELDEYRYRGNGYGMGLSYGYQWILSPRWGIEATFGFGYMYMDYSRYECKTCGDKVDEKTNHYFGPTKAGVSLIYIIK